MKWNLKQWITTWTIFLWNLRDKMFQVILLWQWYLLQILHDTYMIGHARIYCWLFYFSTIFLRKIQYFIKFKYQLFYCITVLYLECGLAAAGLLTRWSWVQAPAITWCVSGVLYCGWPCTLTPTFSQAEMCKENNFTVL